MPTVARLVAMANRAECLGFETLNLYEPASDPAQDNRAMIDYEPARQAATVARKPVPAAVSDAARWCREVQERAERQGKIFCCDRCFESWKSGEWVPEQATKR